MTVVTRAFDDVLLAQLVDAAVADVRPVGRGILHQAQRASSPRARLHAETRAELDDFFVGATQRQMQKAERIEHGVGGLPKRLDQSRQGRFRGTRTLGMAAHTVDHDEQRGMLVDRNGDPVLILFAVAYQADIRGFDLQCLAPVRLANGSG
jgi:hypothetical protein